MINNSTTFGSTATCVRAFLLAGCALGATGELAVQATDQAPSETAAAAANSAKPAAHNAAGFTSLFNGRDLTGWKGLVGSPKTRAAMSPDELAAAQKAANENMHAHWKVVDGVLEFDGKGQSLCTAKDCGDFEMFVDWKILGGGR